MPGALRRHCEHVAVDQLVPPGLSDSPGEIFVDSHPRSGDGGHAGHDNTSAEMVLPGRIELTTSPLPRECSTTELRQRRRAQIGPRTARKVPHGSPRRKDRPGELCPPRGWL